MIEKPNNANWKEVLLWLTRKRKRFRVNGFSMYPALKNGDEVLVDLHAYRNSPPRCGDIVIARHPFRRDVQMIKRVSSIKEDRLYLHGEDPLESNDSRSLGTFKREHILGRVTSLFKRNEGAV